MSETKNHEMRLPRTLLQRYEEGPFPAHAEQGEAIESERAQWFCEECGRIVAFASVRAGEDPVLFGNCDCPGWQEHNYPELEPALRALASVGGVYTAGGLAHG